MASFFGNREEEHHLNNQIQLQEQPQLQPQSSAPSSSAAAAAAHPKKKRNLPGNPSPDAEVIALSPKSLLATNRFVCEVCNKGFQREQNLQLHRRGHNLPWKLKQKSTKEVRRKVYLCPEPTCVHHDPSRALGDLTGIKKHFCRKHGEKKWKCDKCSKKYAVQSDWKAHSKTCGTREYRCDCGTLFSRRDSFITHRAFCDALAQESARIPTGLSTINGMFTNNNMNTLGLVNSQVNSQLSSLQDHQGPSFADALAMSQLTNPNPNSSFRSPSSAFYLPSSSNQDFQEEDPTKPFHHGNILLQLPNLQNPFNLSFFSNAAGSSSTITNSGNPSSTAPNAGSFLISSDQFNSNNSNASASADSISLFAGVSSLYNSNNPPVHNERMLPQMSATALLQKAAQMGATSSGGFSSISKTSMNSQMENDANLQDLMNSLANGNTGIFGGSTRGGNDVGTGFDRFNPNPNLSIGAGSDGLTRDFLGVGSVVRGLGGGLTQREQHQMGSLDSGSPGGGPFGM